MGLVPLPKSFFFFYIFEKKKFCSAFSGMLFVDFSSTSSNTQESNFLGTGFPRYAFPFNESDGECKYEEERFLKLPREMIYKRKR